MNRPLKIETLWVLLLLFWCLIAVISRQARAGEPSSQCQIQEIVVSVKDQKLALIREGRISTIYPVSTSRFGTGDAPGSYATPLGRLVIRKKIGRGLPLGMVFKTRVPTGEVIPPNAPGRDPIVTRILWLDGQDVQNRHAFDRCIYIHGTPQENLLGKPMSYGCIRMRSKDVACLADTIPLGTPVSIIQEHLPRTHQPLRSGLLASLF